MMIIYNVNNQINVMLATLNSFALVRCLYLAAMFVIESKL